VIPVFDYLEQFNALRAALLAAVERVLQSGRLILGPEVEQFERAFADYLGGGWAIGVNSGTDALAIALRALGVGAGREVITVANTAVPTVSAIRMAGAPPVFCEIDAQTHLMDLSDVVRRITPRTKAIIPVHLYGNMVNVARLMELVGGRGIYVVEDCAQAHGATIQGKMAGTLGHAAAFSFYPTKNLGAYGDGGLCFCRDEGLAKEMRRIRMYGFEGRCYAECEGVNSRLDELQAAILSVKLGHLAAWVEQRRALARVYETRLSTAAECVLAGETVQHAYHLFVVRVAERERIRAALTAQGIGTGVHYPDPIHLMNAYRFLGYRPGDLPITEAAATRVLSLPLFPELRPDAVTQVCDALNALVTQ
jgi:dTDP-3-amino-2,3,6-trideoxy-4-keto-D-glucose/dTDP-3-amino-3,4,6-trideoxy-alpha-D-glucose/dTDP-2,6-dideoxy-D-kanosamine transaminase